jgi:hypothetical protein
MGAQPSDRTAPNRYREGMATTWRVQGKNGGYVESTDGAIDADAATRAALDERTGHAVRATFPAVYAAKGDNDPVWYFFAALDALPGATVTGTPPKVPTRDDDFSVVY